MPEEIPVVGFTELDSTLIRRAWFAIEVEEGFEFRNMGVAVEVKFAGIETFRGRPCMLDVSLRGCSSCGAAVNRIGRNDRSTVLLVAFGEWTVVGVLRGADGPSRLGSTFCNTRTSAGFCADLKAVWMTAILGGCAGSSVTLP